MGGKKRNKRGGLRIFCDNLVALFTNVQNFCRLESYRTLPKLSSKLLPLHEERSLNILEETTVIKDNRVEIGLLWKFDVSHS